jgi:hypothetical protein
MLKGCPLSVAKIAIPVIALALLGGCKKTGEVSVDAGVGITAIRSACPHVAVPAGTGDVTLFNPPSSRESTAIDVTAILTNVTSNCNDAAGEQVVTTVNFDVLARRASADGPRDVQLPYFITMVRGGTAVIAKRVGHVNVHFDAGQLRAVATGTATSTVNRAAATLPKERKAGQEDAAMDPLSDPSIRTAVLSATFEALVGFQLTEEQLKYNVTR